MGASVCAASVTLSGRWRLLAGGEVAREVPHASQNLAPGRFSAPQVSQCKGSGAAHSLQNFAPARFSQPQRGQRMMRPSLGKRREQSPGLLEVGCIKAFSKPMVDWCQKVMGFLGFALLLPESSEAGGG